MQPVLKQITPTGSWLNEILNEILTVVHDIPVLVVLSDVVTRNLISDALRSGDIVFV